MIKWNLRRSDRCLANDNQVYRTSCAVGRESRISKISAFEVIYITDQHNLPTGLPGNGALQRGQFFGVRLLKRPVWGKMIDISKGPLNFSINDQTSGLLALISWP